MADESSAELAKKCSACGKALKRAKRYYRNTKYYCNKNCWKTKNKSAGDEG